MQAVKVGKNQIRIAAIACAIVFVCIFALANANAIHRQLNRWALLPRPERLTELYFENHAKLPTTYTAGVPQQFSFVVHNLEYQDTAYRYTVEQQTADRTTPRQIATGTFKLARNAAQTTPVAFTPVDMGNRSLITTTLINTSTNTSQSIYYWITNTHQTHVTPPEGASS